MIDNLKTLFIKITDMLKIKKLEELKYLLNNYNGNDWNNYVKYDDNKYYRKIAFKNELCETFFNSTNLLENKYSLNSNDSQLISMSMLKYSTSINPYRLLLDGLYVISKEKPIPGCLLLSLKSRELSVLLFFECNICQSKTN